MDSKIKTTAGTVTVNQTSPETINIRLTSSAAHPGSVTVVVTNEGNGDEAKLLWMK